MSNNKVNSKIYPEIGKNETIQSARVNIKRNKEIVFSLLIFDRLMEMRFPIAEEEITIRHLQRQNWPP
jgi:hypothetical protein